MMSIDNRLIERIARISWLSRVTSREMDFGFRIVYCQSEKQAIDEFLSEQWVDIKTEAQGELTGYLASKHYEAYGGHWNKLVAQAKELIENSCGEQIHDAILSKALPGAMVDSIKLDLIRFVMESIYRAKFSKAPSFFERLLIVYEAGHLPCGFLNDSADEPLLIF